MTIPTSLGVGLAKIMEAKRLHQARCGGRALEKSMLFSCRLAGGMGGVGLEALEWARLNSRILIL